MIQLNDTEEGPCLSVDTLSFQLDLAHLRYRMQHLHQEALLKACGLSADPLQNRGKTVIDATAGFGQDTLILAASGAQVIAIEKEPILQEWLTLLLPKAPAYFSHLSSSPACRLLKGHANLLFKSLCSLEHSADPIDVIYLDPMFPPRRKSAAVQNNMKILHLLLPMDVNREEENQTLLEQAYSSGARRVVIKKPRCAQRLLSTKKPSSACIPAPTFIHRYRSCLFEGYCPTL